MLSDVQAQKQESGLRTDELSARFSSSMASADLPTTREQLPFPEQEFNFDELEAILEEI